MARALSLFSGSRASRVATRLVAAAPGVDELHLLHFRSPFSREDAPLRELIKAEWPGVSFRTQSLKKEYRRIANIPPQGRFSLTRSCLSCRTIILSRAIRYMERIHADFIVTGEIVGKSGLAQEDLLRIDETLGITGVVLRPLSARLLPETHAERMGWVDRNLLLGLEQPDPDYLNRLASQLGLIPEIDWFDSAHRCKLTFPGFGPRLENLLTEEAFTMNSLRLLDFRLYYKRPPDVKIVLAADEAEKRALQNFFLPQDLRVYLPTYRGPMTLVRTDWATKTAAQVHEIITLASRITATHSDAPLHASVQVNYRFEQDDETLQMNVPPFPSPEEIKHHCIVHHLESPQETVSSYLL